MSDGDTVVATWVESTACGTRFETLTADGQVHISRRPPIGEPWSEGEDDSDCNPVWSCPRAPKAWCQECGGCADCWECSHRPGRPCPVALKIDRSHRTLTTGRFVSVKIVRAGQSVGGRKASILPRPLAR